MKKITFLNHDSKKKIEVVFSKPLTFIYGGNGTGKTTLSRTFIPNETYVFNIDFVNKNVCIINPDGATTDAKTKENFSQLFLGEDSNLLSSTILALKKAKKDIDDYSDRENSKVNNFILEHRLPKFNILEIAKVIKYDFSFARNVLNREINYNQFTVLNSFSTNFSSEEEFRFNLVKFKNENITIDILEKINQENNSGGILKLILLEKRFLFVDEINRAIDEINNNRSELLSLEESFVNDSIDVQKTKNWVEEGLILHSNLDDCFFCKSKGINEQKEKWKNILQSKMSVLKSDLLGKFESMLKSFNILLINEGLYTAIYPKMINALKENYKRINNLLNQLKKNEIIPKVELLNDVDLSVSQQNQLGINLLNYYLNNNLKPLLFSYIFFNEINNSIVQTTAEVNELNEKFAKELSGDINEIQEKLGFNKKILISIDNRGAVPKINLSTTQGKLSDLSEGQRHKLALAVFFAKILKDKKLDKDIVLDDPVISLDVKAYHYLKSLLLEIGKDRVSSNLIILSHNIHYLFIQLSNIFENPILSENATLYELSPKTITEIDLNILKQDDLILFRKTINSVEDINDISIVHWMIPKIFRHYLDIKLRMEGIDSLDNPAEGIKKIQVEQDEINELLEINSTITGNHKKQCIKTNDFFESLEKINRALQILKFPVLVSKKTLELINKLGGKKTIDQTSPKNTLFGIINYGREIVFATDQSNRVKQLSNYINHPRHQLTESMLAIKLEKDE